MPFKKYLGPLTVGKKKLLKDMQVWRRIKNAFYNYFEEHSGHVGARTMTFLGKLLGPGLCQFHVGPYKPDCVYTVNQERPIST